MIHLMIADIALSGFSSSAQGARVLNKEEFLDAAMAAIGEHDFEADDVPGQGFIPCPGAIPFVSCGVGPRSVNPEDYVLRAVEWRGTVEAFLRRDLAAPTHQVFLVVNTREAYLADPDLQGDDNLERIRVEASDATHVLVAVITAAEEGESPLPPEIFLRNLAGANNEALGWSADEIRAKAKELQEYWSRWALVAD